MRPHQLYCGYVKVAASQTDSQISVQDGTYIKRLIINPETTTPGAVSLQSGINSAASTLVSVSATPGTTQTCVSDDPIYAASDVGRSIVISGDGDVNNNGTFTITAYVSSTSVTYTNAAGVADPASTGSAYVIRRDLVFNFPGGDVTDLRPVIIHMDYTCQPV